MTIILFINQKFNKAWHTSRKGPQGENGQYSAPASTVIDFLRMEEKEIQLDESRTRYDGFVNANV